MAGNLRTFSAILSSIGLMMLGAGLLGTIIAINLAKSDVSVWLIGIVMSSYFTGFALGAFSGHLIIARVAHIRAFTVFATLFSAAAFSHAFWQDEIFWSLLRVIEGYSIAGIFICCESWLSEKSDNTNRGTVLSCYMVIIYLSQGLGQLLLYLNDSSSFFLFGVVTVIASLGVIPVALTLIPQPSPPAHKRIPLGLVWRISPLGIVASFTSGVTLGAIFALGPVFATRIGLDINDTAKFMAAFLIGGLALQFPMGAYSDRFDRRKLIAISFGGLMLASAFYAIPGMASGQMVFVGALFMGAFAFVIYPLALAHANDFAEPHQFVGVTAGLLLVYSCGAIVGPLLASVPMSLGAPSALFGFTGLASLSAIGFAIWRMGQREAPTEPETNGYTPLPGTTPVASDLDPRAPGLAPPQESETSQI